MTEKPASEWPAGAHGERHVALEREPQRGGDVGASSAARAISAGRRSIAPCQTRRAVVVLGMVRRDDRARERVGCRCR